MGKGTIEYRGATVLAAGWVSGRWCMQWSDGTLDYYRVQVEPCFAAAYKAELRRQIRNLRKRLARAVKREAVA